MRGALESLSSAKKDAEEVRALVDRANDYSSRPLGTDFVDTVANFGITARKITNEFATAAALLNKRDVAALQHARV